MDEYMKNVQQGDSYLNKLLFDVGFTQRGQDCRWICCHGEPQGVCKGWYSTSLIMNPKAFISPKPSDHSLLLTHTSPRERLQWGRQCVCSSMSGFDLCIFILIVYLSFVHASAFVLRIFKYWLFENVLTVIIMCVWCNTDQFLVCVWVCVCVCCVVCVCVCVV